MATCIYYIKNNSTTAINAAYSLNMNNVSSEFTHINNKTPQNGTVIIGGNQVLSLSFSFRISNYKNRLTLPSMKIVIGEHIHYIKSKNIQCDWIAEVALLGESRFVLMTATGAMESTAFGLTYRSTDLLLLGTLVKGCMK